MDAEGGIYTKLGFEDVAGKKIFYISSEPLTGSRKHVVIMNHGFRGSNIGNSRTFVDFSRLLLNEGFSVLRFDQPNCGNSDEDFIDSSFNEWVSTITYFATRYINDGYHVTFLGQSMGATASVIAAQTPELKGKIDNLLLWMPDPVIHTEVQPDVMYEEKGQKYRGKYWIEAKEANFLTALKNYEGRIHLVFGDKDDVVSQEDRGAVMNIISEKHQPALILPDQGHGNWSSAEMESIYATESALIKANGSTS